MGIPMTSEQRKAIAAIGRAIVETVQATGANGAPGSQFESIMGALVGAGLLRKRGQCYFAQVTS